MKNKTLVEKVQFWWYCEGGRNMFGLRHIRRAHYWIQHRFNPKHRYNIIYLNLEPSYYDPDVRLRHAIFEELVRFLDGAQIEWSATESHQAVYDKLKTAYDWWKTGRPAMVELEEKRLMEWHEERFGKEGDFIKTLNDRGSETELAKKLFQEHHDLEENIRSNDREFMKLIIDNIDYMWYP